MIQIIYSYKAHIHSNKNRKKKKKNKHKRHTHKIQTEVIAIAEVCPDKPVSCFIHKNEGQRNHNQTDYFVFNAFGMVTKRKVELQK